MGLYDYLRKCVVTGTGEGRYLIKGVDPNKWQPLESAELGQLIRKPRERGTATIDISFVEGIDSADNAGAADLDSLVEALQMLEDKEL